MTEDTIEAVARALWQADSQRAAGRARLVDWTDEGDDTRSEWMFMARAAVAAYEAARGDVVVGHKRELVLSSDHRAILNLLAHRNAAIDAHPCTQEIAQALGYRSAAWAHPLLASLHRWGFAQKMGVSFNSGRCWAITDAGRAMIAASQGER